MTRTQAESSLNALGDALGEATALARRTLAWAEAHGVRLGAPARSTAVAASYAHNCAPAALRVTERRSDLAARFILLFLAIDDAEPERVRALLAERGRWAVGDLTPAIASFLAELEPDRGAADPSVWQRFEASYHDYLEARLHELDAPTRPDSIAAHWAFRRRTIFLEPYIDLWMILLGIADEAVAPLTLARAGVVDVVLLANDIGSFERDLKSGEAPDDLNLVDTYSREQGTSRETAAAALIARHNELVRGLRADLGSPAAGGEAYADVLRGMADGNLASLRALRFRYPDKVAMLDRLERVAD